MDAAIPETGFYRHHDLQKLLGVSRQTIYAWRRAGEFPAGIRLPGGLIVWRVQDVKAWLDTRPAA
jgi:predicted DNA-binding transcriptional regulator AlpA